MWTSLSVKFLVLITVVGGVRSGSVNLQRDNGLTAANQPQPWNIYTTSRVASNSGWGSQEGHHQPEQHKQEGYIHVEPLKYYVIPQPQQPKHPHHEHTHTKGWGWGKPHKEEDEFDGFDLLATVKAIKLLKIGKWILIGKLFILLIGLGLVTSTGTILSPVALPLLATPIILGALLLFIPVFFIALFVLALVGDGKEEGYVGQGWGWGKNRRRHKRQTPSISFNPLLERKIMEIMNRFPNMDFHFLPPSILNLVKPKLMRREKKKKKPQ